MRILLDIWRQKNAHAAGQMIRYELPDVNPDMSFLEMLDVLNESLIAKGDDPVAFEHDCREGICGSCGFMINGVAHGPKAGTTVCQLHMRHFKEGDTLTIEAELGRMSARAGKGVGRAILNGQVACTAELMFVLVDA